MEHKAININHAVKQGTLELCAFYGEVLITGDKTETVNGVTKVTVFPYNNDRQFKTVIEIVRADQYFQLMLDRYTYQQDQALQGYKTLNRKEQKSFLQFLCDVQVPSKVLRFFLNQLRDDNGY